MTFQDYEKYDAVALADLVRRKEVTPLELLESAIERTDRLNPALNAVVHRHDDYARSAIAAGLPDGPLRGVPFLLKDLDMRLAGTPLTNGSRLYEGYIPDFDSTLVARHKAAGLVIFGKTNSPEVGMSFATEPLAFGPTQNPWDASLSPGGSSGGTAAAVAVGMVPMAHATDGAGSTRTPAALTGLFGLKPSRGRTPPGPMVSEVFYGLAISHCISRTVRDSAALLDATEGPEPGALHALRSPQRPFLDSALRDPPRLKVALMTKAFGAGGIDPVCIRAAEEAAKLCESLGHDVVEAAPDIDGNAIIPLFRLMVGVLTAGFVGDFARDRGISHPYALMEPLHVLWLREAEAYSGVDLTRAIGAVQAVGRIFARFFSKFDVLLSPVTGTHTLKTGWLNGAATDLDEFMGRFAAHGPFTFPYNASGCPAMSVPFDVVRGSPVGVQFGAGLGREDTLFSLAGQIERARPWIDRLPL
jgi:amidase